MSKNKRIHVRISKEDLQRIDEMAKAAGLSRSAFILQSAENLELTVYGEEELHKVNAELSTLLPKLQSIGNDVNHIAVLCNMGKIQDVRLDNTNEELRELSEALEQLLKDLKKIKPRG